MSNHSNTLFVKGRAASIRVIFFIVLSIVLMTLDHRHDHLHFVRSTLVAVVYPLQFMINLPINAGHWVAENMTVRSNLIKETRRLREERLLLNAKLQRFTVLEEENKRLRELLESSSRINERSVVAELLAVDMQPFRQKIVINKGANEGVYDGQPVVDAFGIMGQVIHVGPFSSTVLLITDPTHTLPVQLNRNGLRAIVAGTGDIDHLRLKYLSNNSDIREGDLVVSSGLGQRFPKGYPVGVITKITPDPGEPFAKVVVRPSAKLGQSHEVLMIWPNEDTSGVEKFEDQALKQ